MCWTASATARIGCHILNSAEDMFTVYEVLRGAEYGCLGVVHVSTIYVYSVRTACAQRSLRYDSRCPRAVLRFCFGRIKYKGQESPSTWVVLGLLVERGRRATACNGAIS